MHQADEAHQAAMYAMGSEEHQRLTLAAERQVNKMMQEDLEARFEPLEVETEPKAHYQYYEPSEGTGGLPAVICTCGQKKRHLRFKVLQRWSEKHFDKTGHNTNAKQ